MEVILDALLAWAIAIAAAIRLSLFHLLGFGFANASDIHIIFIAAMDVKESRFSFKLRLRES